MSNFDPLAVVVDWLDACRAGNLQDLIALYEVDASLDCACYGSHYLKGRSAIEHYWRPKLVEFASGAFSLIDISPFGEGVALDYTSFDGNQWRMHFRFGESGLIRATNCGLLERSYSPLFNRVQSDD